MNMKKKMISLLLVLALVVGICPAAFAGEMDEQPEMVDIELEITDDYVVIVSVPEDKAEEYRQRLENDPEFRQSEIDTALAFVSPARYRPEGNILIETYMYEEDIEEEIDRWAGAKEYAKYIQGIGKILNSEQLYKLLNLTNEYKKALDFGSALLSVTIQVGATMQESWWAQAEIDICNGDISAVRYLLIESVVEYPKAWRVFERVD